MGTRECQIMISLKEKCNKQLTMYQTIGPFTLAKTKIQKTWVFCCTVLFTLPEKPITFWFLGKKSACAKKTWISYWFFGKWCACATPVYLWPYVVRSTSRTAGDSAEGHVPRDQKPEYYRWAGSKRLHWPKNSEKTWQSFKKPHFGGGFFYSGFLQCVGVVA